MNISENEWVRYINKLRKINDEAATKIGLYLARNGMPKSNTDMNALIDYAYGISTKYGEASAEVAAQMFDFVAKSSKKSIPAAAPATPPDIHEVAKTVVGTVKTENEEIVSSAVGRLVKRTGVDTTQQNALRYGAEWAWVPHGDSCAFCIALASRGWQKASKKAIQNGHAEHIHANCDCTYAIRFDSSTEVEGYDPEKYRDMYYGAEGNTPQERINAMRREFYAENKANGMKNLNSSAAEEIDVANNVQKAFTPAKSTEEAEEFAKQYTVGGNYSKVDYSGIDLEYANEFNRAMHDVLGQYEPKYKLRKIEPMNMRKSEFIGSNADAAYKWVANDLFYNKSYFKSAKDFKKHLTQYRTLYDEVAPHLDALIENYKGKTGYLAKKQLDYVTAMKLTGRTNVSMADPYSTMVHELGHYLDDTVFRSAMKGKSFSLSDSFESYAKGISAYATASKEEYVAESFLAYFEKKDIPLDPELVKIFDGAKK